MLYGLYLSAAGLQAQERRQDLIANNLANANTTGFKRDLAIVRSRFNASHEDPRMAAFRVPHLDRQGGGVFLQGGGVDLTQGLFKKTDNPRDLALDGRGFFCLQGDEGQAILTRDGSFIINEQGTLMHGASGRPLLDSSGKPIKLDSDLPVKVTSNGQVFQGENALALKLVDVADPRQLIKIGSNLMTVSDQNAITPIPTSTIVRQGTLELSSVDPVVEMVNMMSGQRVFDANAKMISLQDSTLQSLNTIGRVA